VQAKQRGRKTGGLCTAGMTREVPHAVRSKREGWHSPREQSHNLGELPDPKPDCAALLIPLAQADTCAMKETLL